MPMQDSEPVLPIRDAIHKPEFWIVTGMTTSRILAGLASCYFSVLTDYQSLGGILALYSIGMDLYDGKYARKHQVKTNFGEFLDHRPADITLLAAVMCFTLMLFD